MTLWTYELDGGFLAKDDHTHYNLLGLRGRPEVGTRKGLAMDKRGLVKAAAVQMDQPSPEGAGKGP